MNIKSIPVLRCVVQICSTMVPCNTKLDEYVVDYLKTKGYTINTQHVTDTVEKFSLGSKLFGLYKDDLSRIQKVSLIQELYRSIWIYCMVAKSSETLTPAILLSTVNKKFEEERLYDESLDRNKFSCFRMIDKELGTVESIKEVGKAIQTFESDLEYALAVLNKAFYSLQDYEYMNEIFKIDDCSQNLCVDKPWEVPKALAIDIHHAIENDKMEVATQLKNESGQTKIEMQLRDEIRMLKNDKHDLEVKLSYAKKDSIREFVTTLTGYGWNCPLSELYRLLKDDSTPDSIKGIINNLFMALGSENIKICRDKVGEVITLTSDNQKAYDPYKNEELFLGDKAEIYYPGYRYDHEIMVRPIVRKLHENEEDNSNENG